MGERTIRQHPDLSKRFLVGGVFRQNSFFRLAKPILILVKPGGMKSPAHYSKFLIATAALFVASQLHARPIGFSEISLMVRMHEPEATIKNEVAERRLLHELTQPQEAL